MVQLTVSGDYVTVTVNGSIQEEVNKTTDAIEYNKYSDGKVSLSIGRRSFEMVDPTEFEIAGVAVTDAADFVAKLTAVFGSGGGASYLVYTALLTQTGTDAPIEDAILENTIGNIVWTYSAVGFYVGTLSNAFDQFKTVVFIGQEDYSTPGVNTAHYNNNSSSVYIDTYDFAGALINGKLNQTPIEIRVYP